MNAVQKTEAARGHISELLRLVNGKDYDAEARVWDCSPKALRLMLWNLAGLNNEAYIAEFERQWLALPVDIKRRVRQAIQDAYQFLKDCERCGVNC